MHRRLKHVLRPHLLLGSTLLALTGAFLSPGGTPASASDVTKPITFTLDQDYDKGTDLNSVASDFQLVNQLGITQMRVSFGWDDYEPTNGGYDFTWLQQFVAQANTYGLGLRPYIAYTAPWAGSPNGGPDGVYWNDPPANQTDWYNFVFNLATALQSNSNILSYEIWNEEDTSSFWEGTNAQYESTLMNGSQAVHAVLPSMPVMLGGMATPDNSWLSPIVSGGYGQYYSITPFHGYPESFTTPKIYVENYLSYYNLDTTFVSTNRTGGSQPIWMNETGATTYQQTEAWQANWFLRAIPTFLSDPNIQEIGIFELKDLDPSKQVIGDPGNRYLGLCQYDLTKKEAFSTVQMLMSLLNTGTITLADGDMTISGSRSTSRYAHLFKRPDGKQVLFIWDKNHNGTVSVTLTTHGSACTLYNANGTSAPYTSFNGSTISNITLSGGNVMVFRIDP